MIEQYLSLSRYGEGLQDNNYSKAERNQTATMKQSDLVPDDKKTD